MVTLEALSIDLGVDAVSPMLDTISPSVPFDPAKMSSPAPGPSPFQPNIGAELDILKSLDLHGLRVRWRKLSRTAVPDHLSRPLLLRLIAYKLQALAHGDLDADTARYLKEVAKARARRLRAGDKRKPKQPPPIPSVPAPRGYKAGTLIGREFNGTMHRVIIVDGGFSWNGTTYRSLSEIARLITGTRWNGPRFFGLRKATTAHPSTAPAGSFDDVG